ncbi:hypothetical protein [Psychrobacillus sp. NPDC096623]|uniref:hypothetical protein n=1 Tax=Psychrobacillus sp. NPDC096623 TaxID=3364492 RepID=UPI0037F974CD
MKNSPIKKSIDTLISEEQWLSEELIRKMVKGKSKHYKKSSKRKRGSRFLPLAAILCIFAFSYLLYQSSIQKSIVETVDPTGNLDSIYTIVNDDIDNDYVANVLKSYLSSIYEKDFKSLKQYSFFNESEEDLKTLISRYSNVDFESIRVDAIIPSQAEPGFRIDLVHREIGNSPVEYKHSVNLTNLTDVPSAVVYENLEEKWQEYEPFIAPKSISLEYKETDVFIPEVSTSAEFIDILHTELLGEGLEVQIVRKNGNMLTYLKDSNEIFDLNILTSLEGGNITIQKVNEQLGEKLKIIGLIDRIEDFTLILLDENLDRYQTLSLWSSPMYKDLNGDGLVEIVSNDKDVILFKSNGGSLSVTNLTKAISKNEYTGEIHTEWNDPYIKLTYKNIQGTQNFIYKFNGLNMLELVN